MREKERAESSRSGALDILNFHLGHDHLGARSLSVGKRPLVSMGNATDDQLGDERGREKMASFDGR